MNKAELIDAVAGIGESFESGCRSCSRRNGRCDCTAALKKGQQVSVVGFGTFSVKHRAARSGRNPRTGETIKIAASNVPGFKAGKALKDAVN